MDTERIIFSLVTVSNTCFSYLPSWTCLYQLPRPRSPDGKAGVRISTFKVHLEGGELLQELGSTHISPGLEILALVSSHVFQSHLDQQLVELFQLDTDFVKTKHRYQTTVTVTVTLLPFL